MNGWFPAINGLGEIASGTSEIFFQDLSLGVGWRPRFIDDDTIVYGGESLDKLPTTAIRNVRAGDPVTVGPGCNVYAAGAGRYLGLIQAAPIFLGLYRRDGSVVRSWLECGNPAMSPGGRYVFSNRYFAETHTVFLGEGDAEPVPIYTGATMDLSVCESAVCIMVATGKYTRGVIGIRTGQPPEDWSVLEWEAPIVCDGPNGPWVLGVTQTGLIFRPAGETTGYQWSGEWFNPAVRLIGNVFLIAASDSRGDRKTVWVDPASPRVPLLAPVIVEPLPRIDRAIWYGWFVGTPTAPSPWTTDIDRRTLPGNASVVIAGGETEILTYDGRRIGWYVSGDPDGDSDAIDRAIVRARLAHPGERIVAYWPRKAWGRLPVAGADRGVEGYWPLGMSEAEFEASCREALARAGAGACGIVQAYTSNDGLTKDLRSVARVWARIARDTGCDLLWFSGTGRGTGLQDHLDLLSDYIELAATVTTPPDEPPDGHIDPDPEEESVIPKITVKQFGSTLVKGTPWSVDATIGDTDVTVRIGGDGNLTLTARNPAGEDATGLRRYVEVKGS